MGAATGASTFAGSESSFLTTWRRIWKSKSLRWMTAARRSKLLAVGTHHESTCRTCRRRKRGRQRLLFAIDDRRCVSGRRRGRICDRQAWRFAIGRRLRGNVSLTEQIGKKRLVRIAGEKARQFAAQTIAKAFREFSVSGVFQSMQDERPEQNLSPCVVGALLFPHAGLKRLFLYVELGNSFTRTGEGRDRAKLRG